MTVELLKKDLEHLIFNSMHYNNFRLAISVKIIIFFKLAQGVNLPARLVIISINIFILLICNEECTSCYRGNG